MNRDNYEIVIIGAGMVGLSIAKQLFERSISKKIAIIEKENEIGMHSSGRNSGVIHSGLYYKPKSLKSKVCIEGAKRLKDFINEKDLPINKCGKLILAQDEILDKQLDILFERGKINGAKVEFITEKELAKMVPEARTASGRALWSPNTSVINPKLVLKDLEQELIQKGIKIFRGVKNWELQIKEKRIFMKESLDINYDYLINCSGLGSDKVAQQFGICHEYCLLPFKGIYWQLKKSSKISIPVNLYPVPDLSVPFLGVHFTPNADDKLPVSIGPTATLAFGRENYRNLENIEIFQSIKNLFLLGEQYINNKEKFREYVHKQAFLSIFPLMYRSAKKLVPKLKPEDIELSQKVGIRAQLFNKEKKCLEDDFICKFGDSSTHVLNAISPAFTASFSLADLIINETIRYGNL